MIFDFFFTFYTKTVVFFVNLWKHVYSNNANTFADQIAINICMPAGRTWSTDFYA